MVSTHFETACRRAMESRVTEIEAAIERFRDCGVEIERFSIQEHPGETRLCVDGVARFVWRLEWPEWMRDPGQHTRTQK